LNSKSKMKLYELTYLISPDLSEGELKTLQEKINSFIQEEGGTLAEINGELTPIRKRVAYPIKRRDEIYLTTLSFHLEPEKFASLEKKLKSESQILRYLILTKKLLKKVPEVVVRAPKKPITKPKPKVELKEIEKKLEEILGE